MPPKTLAERLVEHMSRDEAMFDAIVEDIRLLNEDKLPKIQATLAVLEADMKWVKWGVLAIIGSIIAFYFKN